MEKKAIDRSIESLPGIIDSIGINQLGFYDGYNGYESFEKGIIEAYKYKISQKEMVDMVYIYLASYKMGVFLLENKSEIFDNMGVLKKKYDINPIVSEEELMNALADDFTGEITIPWEISKNVRSYLKLNFLFKDYFGFPKPLAEINKIVKYLYDINCPKEKVLELVWEYLKERDKHLYMLDFKDDKILNEVKYKRELLKYETSLPPLCFYGEAEHILQRHFK